MILEVGSCYRVRMGGVVKIEYNSNDLGFAHSQRPFFGRVVKAFDRNSSFADNHIRACFFTPDGMYNPQRGQSDFDIIEEIKLIKTKKKYE